MGYIRISTNSEKLVHSRLSIKDYEFNWVDNVLNAETGMHDDVIKWKHFPRYWPFVRGIHRSPVNSPHKGQWRGALMFSLICTRVNGWVNNREAGELRRYRAHYDVIVMETRVDTVQNIRIELCITPWRICLTHLPIKNMAILQTTFSNAFSR